MILAVVVDGEGRPICTEMMPGNTADVSVLVPVIDRLRHRFGIMRACVVADRGMISEATIAALKSAGSSTCSGFASARMRACAWCSMTCGPSRRF